MSGTTDIYEKVCGHFLLARLNVKGIFERAVVWIYEFSKSTGAHGLILNRPTSRRLDACAPAFAGTPMGAVPVFEGGPVESAMLCFVLRSREALSGGHSIRVGVPPEEILDEIHKPGVRAYGFVGHAEWTRGQLESEIAHGAWMRVRMDAAAWDAGGSGEFWSRLVAKIRRPEAELLLRAPAELRDN